MTSTKSKGNATRYDNDWSGNHLDRIRKNSSGIGIFLNYVTRWCSVCKQKKPTKGGTAPGAGWKCASCKQTAIAQKRKEKP